MKKFLSNQFFIMPKEYTKREKSNFSAEELKEKNKKMFQLGTFKNDLYKKNLQEIIKKGSIFKDLFDEDFNNKELSKYIIDFNNEDNPTELFLKNNNQSLLGIALNDECHGFALYKKTVTADSIIAQITNIIYIDLIKNGYSKLSNNIKDRVKLEKISQIINTYIDASIFWRETTGMQFLDNNKLVLNMIKGTIEFDINKIEQGSSDAIVINFPSGKNNSYSLDQMIEVSKNAHKESHMDDLFNSTNGASNFTLNTTVAGVSSSVIKKDT